MANEVWDTIAAERRRLADELSALEPAQWDAQTICDGWTVRHVLAHLVTPFEISTPRFMATMFAKRFKLEKVTVVFADKLVNRPTDELIAALRSHATNQWTPPGFGAEVPLGEILVHGQDIRAAIGATHTVPDELVELVLSGMKDEAVRDDYAARLAAPGRIDPARQ